MLNKQQYPQKRPVKNKTKQPVRQMVTRNDVKTMSKRYLNECLNLSLLASFQLNLPKNMRKGPFEEMTSRQIFDKLVEEIDELKKELFNENFEALDRANVDRVFSEIGDCAAVLTGLVAWVRAHKKEWKHD